ncbi:MmgE/PrpD family protein [Orbaceae bacterium ESL0721]|nr:MmgE/PrpD family protein [Orbaceae bacterium ESL0721]
MDNITSTLIDKIITSEPLRNPLIKPAAITAIIDYFASSLSARHCDECQKLRQLIRSEGGKADNWLIGQSDLATARQAALFNGFQAHLLDYDDTHADVRGHPSAVILSALFASLPTSTLSDSDPLNKLTSDRFIAAYVIGIELMAQLGIAVGEAHYQKGWHTTATLGGIAATAAICYLHQYPFMRSALAIAATKACGMRLLFGSVIKPLQVGIAAQAAIEAIQFAQLGLKADCDFLDEKIGFLTLYGEGNHLLDLEKWGDPWRIISPGLWFKIYPYCSAASYVADAAKQLQDRFLVTAISHIELIFSKNSDSALIYQIITDPAQGRFSAEFIVASILLNRPLTFNTFSSSKINVQLTDLMSKITRHYDQSALSRYAKMVIYLNDGKQLSAVVNHPKGSPKNPYSPDELKAKFFDSLIDKKLAQSTYQLLSQFEHNIMNIITPLAKLYSSHSK